MRFQDFRHTYFKRISGLEPDPHDAATPRLLSPYRGKKLRTGLDPQDVLEPSMNRASRRSMKFPRPRVRGVALSPDEMPWRAA